MDFLNDEFRRSVGNYKDSANSIAQGAILGQTGVAEARQGLEEASQQEKSAEGTAEVTSKISQQSTKFMKELGIDMSFKPSLGAASGLLNAGGRAFTSAGKQYAFTGEGRMAESANAFTDRPIGVGRSTGDIPERDQIDPDDIPDTTSNLPKANMGDAPEAGEFSFTEGRGGVINTGREATVGASSEPSTVTATPVADSTVTATPIPQPQAPPPARPIQGEGQAEDATRTGNPASQGERTSQEMEQMRAGGDRVGGDFDQRIGFDGDGNPTAGGRATLSRDTSELSQDTEEATQATSEITESVAGTLLDAGGTVLKGIGGFLGDILPFVGPIMAGVGLYEGFHDLNKQYGDAGNDPYAKVRGQIQAGQQKINAMSNNISADQFASKVGGGTPAFGSLAAPTMSSAQQTTGSGHF